MSLTYPIASNAMDALLNPVGMERTLTAAQATAGRAVVFENEWIRPGPERVEELSSAVQMAAAHGAVQVYESEKGKPVIALKYWRILSDEELAQRKADWKGPRETIYASGALWKYAQLVGATHKGAVTHPGGKAEKHVYMDL